MFLLQKVGVAKPKGNEVDSPKSPTDELQGAASGFGDNEITKNQKPETHKVIPLVGSVSDDAKEIDNAHGLTAVYGEGSFHNENYGVGGQGGAEGIAGGFLTPTGVVTGGVGFANGLVGLTTKPIQAVAGVNADGSFGFNSGKNTGLFGFKVPASGSLSGSSFKVDKSKEPVSTEGAEDSVVKNEAETPKPIPVSAQPASTGLFALFRPISVPSFFTTSPLSSFLDTRPRPGDEEKGVEAEAEPEPKPEPEGMLYSLIKPFTPSAIGSSVIGYFKPLTEMSAQGQGSITFTGGASYTGLAPKPDIHKPHKPDIHKPHKPFPPKPPHYPPPVACPGEVESCQRVCHESGKTGGTLSPGSCCSCKCPVPVSLQRLTINDNFIILEF